MTIPQRKATLQKFVSEVRVQSRRTVHPVFQLPLKWVREVFRLVGPLGFRTQDQPIMSCRAGSGVAAYWSVPQAVPRVVC